MGSSVDKAEEMFKEHCDHTKNDIVRDPVNPSHYKDVFPIEVIKMIEAVFKDVYGEDYKIAMDGYMLGNELKYRFRAGFKEYSGMVEDIQKALQYNTMRRGK
jgi:hypothetical protein